MSSGFIKPVNCQISFVEEPMISLDFKDAGLKDILKVFSIQSGLNFIASEDIQDKRITLYLDKVPLKEAMDKLFKANNLLYELDEEARIFVVKPSGLPAVETITRIYTLRYASVSSSSLKEEMRSFLARGRAGEGIGIGGGEREVGITEAIKKLLTPDVGKLIEEPRTNSLIITDVASKFPLIEEIIRQLDVPVPQVMLEVEMLDVSKDVIDKLGIKFGDLTNPSVLNMVFQGPIRGTTFPLKHYESPRGRFIEGSVDFSKTSYTVLLDFLKSQSDTRVLARPRILTLNNETAEIGVIRDEVVSSERKEDIKEGVRTISYTYKRATDLKLTSEGVGVFLRVTPQINVETKEITLCIRPKISTTTLSPVFRDPEKGILVLDPEVRNTVSVVKVRDGETIVLGGLIHYQKEQVITKLPILGDIPLIGALFRHKNKAVDKERELLVFITPRIIGERTLARVSPNLPLEREQVLEQDVLRYKTMNNILNNLERVR